MINLIVSQNKYTTIFIYSCGGSSGCSVGGGVYTYVYTISKYSVHVLKCSKYFYSVQIKDVLVLFIYCIN